MIEPNPRITRKPKWILASANWEKYQNDLEAEMRKLQQPISSEKITSTIQKCAKENIKKNKRGSSKKKSQMENNRDYNINQRKKKSGKNVQANSIYQKPYC
jgi:hypothetical protein